LILSAFGSLPLCSYRVYSPGSKKASRQLRWFVLWPEFMSELLKEEKRMRIETGGLMLIENRPISISVTPLVPSPFYPLVRRPLLSSAKLFPRLTEDLSTLVIALSNSVTMRRTGLLIYLYPPHDSDSSRHSFPWEVFIYITLVVAEEGGKEKRVSAQRKKGW